MPSPTTSRTCPSVSSRTTVSPLIHTFLRLGGSNLSINVIDAPTLQAARADPGRNGSLSVRAFGYSEYFVHLDRTLQDYLIVKANNPSALSPPPIVEGRQG